MRRFAILFALALGAAALGGCKAWDLSDPLHPRHGNRHSVDGCEPCVRCDDCCPCDTGCTSGCANGQPAGPGY